MKSIPADFKLRAGFSAGPIPAVARKMVSYLETLPFKELIEFRELARAVGVKYKTMKDYSVEPSVQANKYSVHVNRVWWGSKRTIKELRKRNAEG